MANNGYRSIQFFGDHLNDGRRRSNTAAGRPDADEHLLSKSDLSSFASDDSLTPLPPTIPIRKRSLQERRNVEISPLQVNGRDADVDAGEHRVVGGSAVVDIDETTPVIMTNDAAPIIVIHGPAPPAGRLLRRNSMSMPSALNKLGAEVIEQQLIDEVVGANMADSNATLDGKVAEAPPIDRLPRLVDAAMYVESDDENSRKPIYRSSLRTKRRLSVAPLPSIRANNKLAMSNNAYDGQSMLGNQASVNSNNSLAGLLKEKMQSFPSMIRRKKQVTSDFKIKAFVSMLFLTIVFLVGYAYIMYHSKVLAHLYFDKVKFDKVGRSIKIYNDNGHDMLTGSLGKNIWTGKPFKCLDRPASQDSMCFEWDNIARLQMDYEPSETHNCYAIKWQSKSTTHFPEDCYDFKESKGHWYGGGITKDNDWPFDKSTFEFAPFITGDAHAHQFGNALRRYFINSNGVAILIDERTPLHISMNKSGTRQFCMKAMNDNFAFVNRLTPQPELKYSICVGANMKALHKQLMPKMLWDGLKPGELEVVKSVIEEPIWQIPAASNEELSESSIYNYTEDVMKLGFLRLGHVLINEFWQTEIGDFTLDTKRFPTLEKTVNVLHRRGFKVAFTIQPFISTNSQNFGEAVRRKILIYERLSERSISALTRYKSSPSSGVLDVTNTAAIPWLAEKLQKVVDENQIDSFYVDFGTAYNMPHYYQCNRSLINPDQYKTLFTSSIDESVALFGVSGAVSVPRPPAFLGLPPVNSSWDGLQSIVTTALSYGVLGFPFIMPGAVGGDYLVPANLTTPLSYTSLGQPPLPEQELFVRWLQLATFLPSIRFSHLPSEYQSDFVTDVAKGLTTIRQKTIIPIFMKYINDALNDGLPLVRPLWMIDINDPACLYVNDEFSIGEEIIVAPILRKGQTKREVYLPHGVWKDGVDGSLRKGSRWIHNYRVPLEKVAYFVKMPDNTRF